MKTGYLTRPEKDKRQQAVNWWFKLPLIKRKQLKGIYYPKMNFSDLQRAGHLLEVIYNEENNK